MQTANELVRPVSRSLGGLGTGSFDVLTSAPVCQLTLPLISSSRPALPSHNNDHGGGNLQAASIGLQLSGAGGGPLCHRVPSLPLIPNGVQPLSEVEREGVHAAGHPHGEGWDGGDVSGRPPRSQPRSQPQVSFAAVLATPCHPLTRLSQPMVDSGHSSLTLLHPHALGLPAVAVLAVSSPPIALHMANLRPSDPASQLSTPATPFRNPPEGFSPGSAASATAAAATSAFRSPVYPVSPEALDSTFIFDGSAICVTTADD